MGTAEEICNHQPTRGPGWQIPRFPPRHRSEARRSWAEGSTGAAGVALASEQASLFVQLSLTRRDAAKEMI